MGNILSVRRVMVQTIDSDGLPEGKPTFGILAADNYAQVYNDTFETFDELNKAIEEAGNILDVIDEDGWLFYEFRKQVGTENFCGKVKDDS